MMYSEAKAYLDEIAAKNKAAKDSLRVVKTGATNVKSLLAGMQAQYGPAVAAIVAEAAANPGNEAWQVAAAETGLLVADFGALKTTAGEMVTALEPFEV